MNFLVTAIGSFSADSVISTLCANGDVVYGCDIYPKEWHAVSKKCADVYLAPLATREDDYIQFLLGVCKDRCIDCIVPLTDIEIDVINRHRNKFDKTTLAMQDEYCLSVARDKYAMCRLFENEQLFCIPKTIHSLDQNCELKFPAIAKPVNGRSSEGVLFLNSKDDLLKSKLSNNYIVQEFVSGNVYTVDYVRDRMGGDFAIPREELLRTKNGAGITVRMVLDTKLKEMASYIGNTLNVCGAVNMEFIYNDGNYYLIDINPRFSAGIAFTQKVGYDIVSSHINAIYGRCIAFPVEYPQQIITKKYIEEVSVIE